MHRDNTFLFSVLDIDLAKHDQCYECRLSGSDGLHTIVVKRQ